MFLSVLNSAEVVIYNISHIGIFANHPAFLVLTILSILFTVALTRYKAHQKTARLARETNKRHTQIACVLRQQQLTHQMMQNQERS